MGKAKGMRATWAACSILLGSSCAAFAQVQAAVPAQSAEPDLVVRLVASANFWRSQNNIAYARHELGRALLVAPSNADVLADSAEMALDAGDIQAADEYRRRLSRVAPDSLRTKALAAEHALTPDEAAMLMEARRLGTAGDARGALQKYAALLRGGVPPVSLEVEYYTQLSATPDGFEQAVDKLGTLAELSPANAQLQLALARIQTLQEETRPAGLRRLIGLVDSPVVGDAARQSWRDALSWQGASEKARSQVEAYLARYPGDSVLEAKKKDYDAILPDASTKAMIRGYNLMASDIGGAEREFRDALSANPNNPDAMSMMAAILRISKRPAEAQVLLNRAVALAPDRKAEFYTNAGGDFTGKMAIGKDELLQVANMTAMGHYQEAEQLLASLTPAHATAPLLVQLADLQRRAGHLDSAVESLRSSYQLTPVNADADCTLAEVLTAQSHYGEASASLDQAQKLYTKSNSTVGLRRVSMDRAALQQAQRTQVSSAAPAKGSVAVVTR